MNEQVKEWLAKRTDDKSKWMNKRLNADAKKMHYGTKPGHFDTLKIHFLKWASERTNKRTDEQVTKYLSLYFWLLSTIVYHTIARLLQDAAQWRGVQPSESWALTSHPNSTKNLTISKWPAQMALCKAEGGGEEEEVAWEGRRNSRRNEGEEEGENEEEENGKRWETKKQKRNQRTKAENE